VDAATEALSPITAREDATNEGAKVAAEVALKVVTPQSALAQHCSAME
jgi:hypothetical protein